MKLRNKKTGEVFDALIREKGCGGSYSLIVCDIKAYEQSKSTLDATHFVLDEYDSLADLNEEWEDYEPKEPYIGDEATAKFVRAWAEHWGIEKVMARIRFDHGVDLVGWIEDSGGREIDIQGAFVSGEIKDCNEYTIVELCGEDEDEA